MKPMATARASFPIKETRRHAPLRSFVRKHGNPRLRVPWGTIIAEVECLRINTGNAITQAGESTKQHRDRLAELNQLADALAGLSWDTVDHLLHHVGRGIMHLRGANEWSTTLRDIDGIKQGVQWAIESLPRKKKRRGKGHVARLRRRFIREAALPYLMAGFDTIATNQESMFMAWCNLVDEVCGLGLARNNKLPVTFTRAIREEIGKTEDARNAWAEKNIAAMKKRFPEGCDRNF